ncbi:MAG: tRNA (N(6)-L-threonylcarbamoyladenosine(37)-C(2))-methylthiotransferase MtaB [Bacteroidetes bacterium]|nr:tRNA (N(6)-L-threonylcarbamoyladenosine(37)-C(2))-methylthiotransferase MtaB [Bacteroidota bacterium]
MSASSVAFHTLGCKLNFSESSALSRQLSDQGFQAKSFEEVADVYVINTCSVTAAADKECRSLVRRIQRKAPEAIVVVTGCYAQLKPDEIAAIDGVDLVLGAAEKFNLATHLREIVKGKPTEVHACEVSAVGDFHASFSLGDRTRSFLKVQDGCDYNCSFCTIPQARGASRSNTIEGVLKNVEELAQNGIKEIVLTGINLGDFGKGQSGGKTREENFLELAHALENVATIDRFRISSIEPNLLNESIIELVANSKKFMPHFHIPLQSGSDKILGLMRRRYRRDLYADRVQAIKIQIPHCALGVDVIVGFPGETDQDFEETYQFLDQLDVSYFHVFTYSERANTLAATMEDVVPIPIRHERNKRLRNLSFKKQRDFHKQHLGQIRPVLWEKAPIAGMMEGYTDNYIKLTTPYRADWANTIQEHQV